MENTPHRGDKKQIIKEKRCIVSRRMGIAEEMIRFVATPEGQVIADIKGNLPGRGAWVFANSALVRKAAKTKVFARALKKEVQIPADLARKVDNLLSRAALANLSLARRGGAVITGAEKVEAAIRSGRAVLALHAAEAAADGKRKIAQAAFAVERGGAVARNMRKEGENADTGLSEGKYGGVKIFSPFTAEELQSVFGGHNVIHVAIINSRAAHGFIKAVLRLIAYRDEDRNII